MFLVNILGTTSYLVLGLTFATRIAGESSRLLCLTLPVGSLRVTYSAAPAFTSLYESPLLQLAVMLPVSCTKQSVQMTSAATLAVNVANKTMVARSTSDGSLVALRFFHGVSFLHHMTILTEMVSCRCPSLAPQDLKATLLATNGRPLLRVV